MDDLGNYIFESQRIGFRNWKKSDLELFSALNSDAVVMKNFPNKLSTSETEAFIVRLQKHYLQNAYTFFAADLLQNKELIGFIGLVNTNFDADFTPCLEIGWRLKKEVWNQGLATEGALRCLQFAFEDLKKPEVFSFTSLGNLASERIMQKIGMTKISEFKHPKLDQSSPLLDHALYRIKKEEFKKA